MIHPLRAWEIRPAAPRDAVSALGGLPPLIAQLLYHRGVRTESAARAFLDGESAGNFDPFDLPDMEQAVQRLRLARARDEQVVVFGDFDADGITGTALLVEGLSRFGIHAQPYIPHRDAEGYGLNIPALQALRNAGAGLVVTVDCGTSSVEEIAYASDIGLDVIVADHHAIPPELPRAVAVINPHRQESRYPFDGLCGAGVAFKLLQALALSLDKSSVILDDLLDLVAIGTVADMAPLYSENRQFVQRGIAVLRSAPRIGLQKLMMQARLQPSHLDGGDIGFTIAPRLNAMGRLSHALSSFRLLTTQDEEEAGALAELLEATNRERQRLTQETLNIARRAAEAAGPEGAPLIFVEGEEYPAGIVGLVASRLAEEHYRPAVVIERGEELSRGSARSIPEVSIVHALAECRDIFLRYGGHDQAAGFTIRTERLPEMRERLSRIIGDALQGKDLQPRLTIDAETHLRAFPGETMKLLGKLGPYGTDNPEPLFATRNVRVLQARTFGNGDAHLELRLEDGKASWRAVGFGMADRYPEITQRLDVAYSISLDRWQGRDLLQLRLKDLRPAVLS